MTQIDPLASGDADPEAKPASTRPTRLRILITVKAAPQPSASYGETVCVAGLRLGVDRHGWVRLYPVPYRFLDDSARFAKYDIVEVDAVPATEDRRSESWKPRLDTLRKVDHLPPWTRRRGLLEPMVVTSMCGLLDRVKRDPPGWSLALVRPRSIAGVEVKPHPGWTRQQQTKLDAVRNQVDLFDQAIRSELEAPRFSGWYRYGCHAAGCGGHRQGILDWEFVALQRRLSDLDDAAAANALRDRFSELVCGSDRDTAFHVGNQAKREHVFSVLGAYWPPVVNRRR